MSILNKIKNLFAAKRTDMAPPFISHAEKQQIIEKYRAAFQPSVFVETGTYMGDMIEAQKHKFSSLFSIELSTQLYTKAKERFKNDLHVEIVNGDSATALKPILNKIEGRVLFWLDGHYSGGITAKGKSECPVIDELKSIFGVGCDCIVLIDDARLFVGKYDYPTIEELKKLLSDLNTAYSLYVEADIICITNKNQQYV
jgi:hypothetical protein